MRGLKPALTFGVGHGWRDTEHTRYSIDANRRELNTIVPNAPTARPGAIKTRGSHRRTARGPYCPKKTTGSLPRRRSFPNDGAYGPNAKTRCPNGEVRS